VRPSVYDNSRTTRSSGALPASLSCSTKFGRLLGDAHNIGYAKHGTLNSTGPSVYDHSHTTHGSGALLTSSSGSAEFGRLSSGTHDFGYAQRDALDSTRTTCGPSVTTHGSEALPTSPSSCTRATITASTSAVTASEGYTSGTSDESSSDDHASEAGLLTFG
jgi:hypothetical protein